MKIIVKEDGKNVVKDIREEFDKFRASKDKK